MAEVVIVSVVVAVTLVALFTGVNRVSNAYEKRNKYHDIDAEYLCIEVNKALIQNSQTNLSSLTNINNEYYIGGLFDYKDKFGLSEGKVSIYYSSCDILSIETIKNRSEVNQTFIDYIDYLKGNLDCTGYESGYVIISEVCKTENDCGYYTLKVKG